MTLTINSISLKMTANNSPNPSNPSEKTALLSHSSPLNNSSNLSSSPSRTRLAYNSLSINNVDEDGRRDAAVMSRYKYYSRLAPPTDNTLSMPDHVVPAILWTHVPVEPSGKQNSLITIFSIWNTMMGTSLLSMPWAISQAGFGLGLGLMILVAAMAMYTAYRVMQSVNYLEDQRGEVLEFSVVCRQFLGRFGEYSAVLFSGVCLLGGAIVYWVLMSNFLYYTVLYIHNQATGHTHDFTPNNNSELYNDAYIKCSLAPPQPNYNTSLSHYLTSDRMTSRLHGDFGSIVTTPSHVPASELSMFNKYWNLTNTVPFFLIIILFPLISLKSPTFFTKFNALGTISVLYLLGFVTFKTIRWGFHLDFSQVPGTYAAVTFPALTGILSLGYFIHNCVLSIVRNQAKPENNGRDLTIAFICVAVTYSYVGCMFYAAWPMITKDCIKQNLLDNLTTEDPLAFIARIFLFLQMVTVFPLLIYIFRIQVMHTLFNAIWPSWKHVIVLNLLVVGICLVFAVFMPHIGEIIRYAGAISGLMYIHFLPCSVYILHLRKTGKLTWFKLAFHVGIILVGVSNFIAQFFIPSSS